MMSEADARQGVQVRRAGRDDLAPIAEVVREATAARVEMDEADVMEWLFSKGLWVAEVDGAVTGVAAWQVENLLCVTDVFYVAPPELLTAAGGGLLSAIEEEADTLMCEANVVVLPGWTGDGVRACLAGEGYEPKAYEDLHYIWREVLQELTTDTSELLVKRLRDRMVMAPV
ncbi:MAG: hypothetical protein PVG11_08205 [Anaerolineae bacterium]|jgi:hypothetical protein